MRLNFCLSAGGASSSTRRSKVSRKEARKQQRLEKRHNKAQFFTSGNDSSKRRADLEHQESPQRKKRKVVSEDSRKPFLTEAKSAKKPTAFQSGTSPAASSNLIPQANAKSSKDLSKMTALDKLAARSKRPAIHIRNKDSRSQEEIEEDAYIARLEAKLGRKKGGKLEKEWEDDGLDGKPSLLLLVESMCADTSYRSPKGFG